MTDTATYDELLRTEFRDQAQDRLASLNATITSLASNRLAVEAALASLSRDTQNLKGLGAGYGFPVVNMAAQRLETYLAGLTEFQPKTLNDLQHYADKLNELVEAPIQPDPVAAAALLQALPTRYEFSVGDVAVKHIEIMVVTPTRVLAKVVSGELGACGFRPVVLHDPVEALAQAIRVPPGMIMASVVMEPINGVEFVRVLKGLRATQKCPMAVLTSLEGEKKPLHELPPDVAVIHTGAHFGSDFATVTAQFALG